LGQELDSSSESNWPIFYIDIHYTIQYSNKVVNLAVRLEHTSDAIRSYTAIYVVCLSKISLHFTDQISLSLWSF